MIVFYDSDVCLCVSTMALNHDLVCSIGTSTSDTTTTTSADTTTVRVMYPKDWVRMLLEWKREIDNCDSFQEKACVQPVAIMTGVCTLVVLPLKVVAMFLIFTRASKLFNPNILLAQGRHFDRVRRLWYFLTCQEQRTNYNLFILMIGGFH